MLVVDTRRRRRDPKARGERRWGWNRGWGQTHQGEGRRRATEVGQHAGGLIHTSGGGDEVLGGRSPPVSRVTRVSRVGPWRYSFPSLCLKL